MKGMAHIGFVKLDLNSRIELPCAASEMSDCGEAVMYGMVSDTGMWATCSALYWGQTWLWWR
jgi:hypothetical protein